MASTSDSSLDPAPGSRLAAPDSRPIVVTLVVVGFLLICVLGGLNAFVVLVNGSTRIDLVESPPPASVEAFEFEREMAVESLDPQLVVLERLFAATYFVVAIAGIVGAIGLLNRKSWSRVLLWTTAGAAIAAHVFYTVRVLQIQTAQIPDVLERQEVFELVAATSLMNVAIQSIPLAILAGLLRHRALRRYLFDSADGLGSPVRDEGIGAGGN